ncbi:MAG TPA: adenine phosphoribosyltransferase [Ohtaekwangia sp.]|uniref:adenine phosphoribosyltransferase n=1 Tax=Ohtaekwangia sp. TaxID=2066019 RepID=UPI002F9252A8
MLLSDKIKHAIRDVYDYPKPGIIFKDITPVLSDPSLMHEIIGVLRSDFKEQKIDAIAAVEARGFIFGSILAHELNCRFIPIRKAGKLPYKVRRKEYDLEYGTACIEMHEDAVQPGWRVLVQDDLLATGGTAAAAGELIESLGASVVGFSFIINLSFLPGAEILTKRFGVKPHYLIEY